MTSKSGEMYRKDHEWIEVRHRRWCVGCDAFQYRVANRKEWAGIVPKFCPRNTPRARQQDRSRGTLPVGDDAGKA
jgi:hypothetical protein